MLKKPLRFSHEILKNTVILGDTVIDATAGNGNDTVLLAQLVGQLGKVYAFDIQEDAIKSTKEKLILTGQSKQVELILDGHENLDQYLDDGEKVSAVTFNLGYLPRGDKSITTQADTTLTAIKNSLKVLRKQGVVSIMVYYGHDEKLEEKNVVDKFVTQIPQEEFDVLTYRFVNQANQPPYLYLIQKK